MIKLAKKAKRIKHWSMGSWQRWHTHPGHVRRIVQSHTITMPYYAVGFSRSYCCKQ